ncbi:MAG TPA: RNA polymerase sigma factor [Vicinamibacterales bacterium]|nr:RNA polymerase sigma factor [Vicinamibacterales bacterium]
MAGDPERERRFLELVAPHRARLVRLARAYAGAEWADLHQEILLQVWRGLDSFQGRSSVSTWLYRVALNTALTWRRRAAPAAAALVPQGEAPREPAGELSPRDPMRVLDEFLGTLDPVDRAVLVLYLEDASYAEIADVTGLSENHVGVKLNRLKRAFVDRYIGDRR